MPTAKQEFCIAWAIVHHQAHPISSIKTQRGSQVSGDARAALVQFIKGCTHKRVFDDRGLVGESVGAPLQ